MQNILSKSEQVREIIMSDHELLDAIGPAWQLYFYLIFAQGTIIGTYDDIGIEIGEKQGRTVRNWTDQLKTQRIIQCLQKGKRVEIKLCEPHLAIALAPDHIPVEQPESDPSLKDPKILGMLKMYEGANQMDAHIEFLVKPNAS